jgi:hypothetical protein
MRTLGIVVGGAALAALGGVVALRGTPARGTPAPAPQQAAAPAAPDSAVAPVLAAGDTARLKGPRQPIFFRHDIHSGQYKMQCQYCHYSVDVSPEPGIPTTQTCMGCHLVIAGRDSSHQAEIKKLRDYWAQKKPVEWVRIHLLPRHAHFPHHRHVKALGPTACATCHGDVTRMPQVYQVNAVERMGFCISCHVERNVSRDCSVCHY